jgi:hypothetical protein
MLLLFSLVASLYVSQATDCCYLHLNLEIWANYHNFRNLTTPNISVFILVKILIIIFTVTVSNIRKVSGRNEEILMID